MNRKAVSLLSGGLDSVLATRIIKSQGIEVVGLHFTSPFKSRREKERGVQALKSADELGIRLIIKEKDLDFIEIIKNPKHGYGKNMNPCIDCRIYMLKIAKAIMEEEGADFVITGEVLGQRPMSQRRDTINIIEKESGLKGLILRPLSAIYFPETIPEQEGIIDRSKLFNISGRSRSTQYELVKEFGLKEFGCPGGGCLLTEPVFSRRLKDLFKHDIDFNMKDVKLLSIGRHFRLDENTKVIIGRNKMENEMLSMFWSEGYNLVTPSGFTGPIGLIKGKYDNDAFILAANIIYHFSKSTDKDRISVEIKNKGDMIFHAEKRLLDIEKIII